ncbi:MAG: ATP-binding protein, partial [Oscillospiraceae bacterium]|nr:ATP-binding protein [Oscillospiraceae bacterium]
MKSQIAQTVTIAQAKQTLDQTVELYFSKDSQGRYRMDRHRARPVCLMGPTGIGKTEIVRQVAQERGLAFLSYSVTHHTRQSAIGLPRLTERQMADKRVCVTEYTVSEIVAEVWRVMEESGKQEGILFLDEF